MTCNRIALLLLIGAFGCQHEVETVELSGHTGEDIRLRADDDLDATSVATFRWELVDAPEGSPERPPASRTEQITIAPSRRGVYVYDRWIEQALGDELTHHFVISVAGVAPIPLIVNVADAATVGAPVVLDSSVMASVGPSDLTFRWRLVSRPYQSTATIESSDAPTATLVPDVRGTYEITLEVFDGELWNVSTASQTVVAEQ